MDWIDRIALLLKRYPPPQYQQPPGAPPPATVYVQQVPRRKISRSAMAGVAVVLVLAFFFARSAAHVSAPAQKTPSSQASTWIGPEFSGPWQTFATPRKTQRKPAGAGGGFCDNGNSPGPARCSNPVNRISQRMDRGRPHRRRRHRIRLSARKNSLISLYSHHPLFQYKVPRRFRR